MTFDSFYASAPGKVILCGEHAVVHGSRALATVIDKRTFTQFSFQNALVSLRINHSQLTLSLDWPLIKLKTIAKNIDPKDEIPHYLLRQIQSLLPTALSEQERSSSIVFLIFCCYLFRSEHGFCCTITSNLPIGAGLGASAAFSVALATGFIHLNNIKNSNGCLDLSEEDKSLINMWALQGEQIFHKNPSGIDNTVISYGGIISYQKGKKIMRLGKISKCMQLVVTNTCITRSTSKLVEAVHELREEFTEIVDDIVQVIDKIAYAMMHAIFTLQKAQHTKIHPQTSQTNDIIEFNKLCSKLFLLNEGLLWSLGVGHPAIDRIINIGKEFNFQSKLTGAGGGGCVITLIPPSAKTIDIQKFKHNLCQSGFEPFEVMTGQDGVSLHRIPTNEKQKSLL